MKRQYRSGSACIRAFVLAAVAVAGDTDWVAYDMIGIEPLKPKKVTTVAIR